jgi:hypothetical protein
MTNTQTNSLDGYATLKRGSKSSQIQNPELYMTTAGGKIRCRRCAGVSSRTKQQCKHPALRTSKKSRCKWHAGSSTGPRTEVGKNKIRAAHWKDGSETIEAKAERKKVFAELNQLAKSLGIINPRKRVKRLW